MSFDRLAADQAHLGRIVDLAAGHGLLAQLRLILDDTSPCAPAVDAVVPPSAATLHHRLRTASCTSLSGPVAEIVQRGEPIPATT